MVIGTEKLFEPVWLTGPEVSAAILPLKKDSFSVSIDIIKFYVYFIPGLIHYSKGFEK